VTAKSSPASLATWSSSTTRRRSPSDDPPRTPPMSREAHTAAWRWERRGCRVYSSPPATVRPRLVANVNITGLDEAGIEARGRLIAAAPALLEACKRAEAQFADLAAITVNG